MSPELVLVDPELAADVRSVRAGDEGPIRNRAHALGAAPVIEPSAALRRLVELCDVEPPRPRRRFRAAKLGLAFAAWGTAALIVVDTRLYSM